MPLSSCSKALFKHEKIYWKFVVGANGQSGTQRQFVYVGRHGTNLISGRHGRSGIRNFHLLRHGQEYVAVKVASEVTMLRRLLQQLDASFPYRDVWKRVVPHEEWTPLQTNVVVCCITVLYGKLIFEFTSWVQRRRTRRRRAAPHMHNTSSKQMIYILWSTTIFFWPLYDRSDGWSWRLNTVFPLAVCARLVYKGCSRDPNASTEDVEVHALSRSAPSELLWGPLQFMILLSWLGLYRFRTDEAAISMAAVGIGDALAPLFGASYGRHVYQMPLGRVKTMEGSLCGVFLGTCAASYFFCTCSDRLYCHCTPCCAMQLLRLSWKVPCQGTWIMSQYRWYCTFPWNEFVNGYRHESGEK